MSAERLDPAGPATVVPVRLPPPLVAALDQAVECTGRTRSDLVRVGIEHVVNSPSLLVRLRATPNPSSRTRS